MAGLLARLRAEYGCKKVYLSVYGENRAAARLYAAMGFRENGALDENGEKIMEYVFA